jgi:glycosyltransferase involved in cell wall biosynthesis
VEDGKSGFLVSPRSPDELADAILKIMSDPELAKQLGSFGRELSETRFSWIPIAGEIARAYEMLLASNDADRL